MVLSRSSLRSISSSGFLPRMVAETLVPTAMMIAPMTISTTDATMATMRGT